MSKKEAPKLQTRRLIEVCGIVQGVGFRPFIYLLAKQHQLQGWVLNHPQGVHIDVQGPENELDIFIKNIRQQAPPLSQIDSITCKSSAVHSLDDMPKPGVFSIRQSSLSLAKNKSNDTQFSTHISADFSICNACLDDIRDPNSRYYRYPLTNCTHCGPRFSIINALPYDRKNTSMADFVMCPECLQAYEDPANRRYHAQPISCPRCGPQIQWRMSDGSTSPSSDSMQVLQKAASAIRAGKIIAIKGIGGFHLVCDASNQKAVNKLRISKNRPLKPLAIMVKDRTQAQHYVQGGEAEWALLGSQQRPITLLQKHDALSLQSVSNKHNKILDLASNIAENVPYLGIMLPYTPLHYLLFDHIESALVFTSANYSGQPILIEGDDVATKFQHCIAGFIDHPRKIVNSCDDSLVHFSGGQRQMLRLGRGFAPYYFALPNTLTQPVLATGAQQKVSFALGAPQNEKQSQALISPYIGDLNNLEMQQDYQHRVMSLTLLHQIKVAHYCCDKHPRYATHRWAHQQVNDNSADISTVPHHYAHVLSVMAEYQLQQRVLGFSFDGTGLGDIDSTQHAHNPLTPSKNCTLWGGEVLIADIKNSHRCYSLKAFRLIGGEQAITSPARLLFALLLEYYSIKQIQMMHLSAFEKLGAHQLENWHVLWEKGINSPYTSSIGRFIDAYCALLSGLETISFEGECGLLLEQLALNEGNKNALSKREKSAPLFTLNAGEFDFLPLLKHVIERLTADKSTSLYQQGASLLFTQLSALIITISDQYPTLPIVLCGGVFQNRVLMDCVLSQLKRRKKTYYVSQTIPLNDGGIAAGQLWFVAHKNTLENKLNTKKKMRAVPNNSE
ncbi:(NiFe) hydrogenase maturation protein HypF [Psychromonas sp. CNPT3]|uniref:carbamoyltransferase HypF n=1 Tax=Psychromonas sp. CNPT3 TaxID=314282 RepID=UPI00006E8908|nr:carbamoyltransferase HypF [Psychromonas sp. CNPT3]AGH82395.1 (NiFe) hydrogenase maturation protein HypF [Psychromonas sp. CNPT3]